MLDPFWILFLAAFCFASLANVFFILLLARINRKRPVEQQIPYFRMNIWRLAGDYRRLYPNSRLYVVPWLSTGFAFAFMIAFIGYMFSR
ncbi:MAG TPA: hypothetical protein VI488_07900 [Candidatus Angelobacter sp.]